MSSVVKNQKKPEAIECGLAYFQAYSYSKTYKAILWFTTFVVATVQLVVAAVVLSKYMINIKYLELFSVITLTSYVLFSIFIKNKIKYWHNKGCKIHCLHDYLVLEAGIDVKDYEITASEKKELAATRLKKDPAGQSNFSSWYKETVDNVSFANACIICAHSNFSWDVELRKKYRFVLFAILIIVILSIIIFSIYYNFSIREVFILVIAPSTPFISLIIEEIYDNFNCVKSAEDISINSSFVIENIYKKRLSDLEIRQEFEVLIIKWQTYRFTTAPIFHWLYKLTKKPMNMSKVINVESMVKKIKLINNNDDFK